jgi:hypothetical protein
MLVSSISSSSPHNSPVLLAKTANSLPPAIEQFSSLGHHIPPKKGLVGKKIEITSASSIVSNLEEIRNSKKGDLVEQRQHEATLINQKLDQIPLWKTALKAIAIFLIFAAIGAAAIVFSPHLTAIALIVICVGAIFAAYYFKAKMKELAQDEINTISTLHREEYEEDLQSDIEMILSQFPHKANEIRPLLLQYAQINFAKRNLQQGAVKDRSAELIMRIAELEKQENEIEKAIETSISDKEVPKSVGQDQFGLPLSHRPPTIDLNLLDVESPVAHSFYSSNYGSTTPPGHLISPIQKLSVPVQVNVHAKAPIKSRPKAMPLQPVDPDKGSIGKTKVEPPVGHASITESHSIKPISSQVPPSSQINAPDQSGPTVDSPLKDRNPVTMDAITKGIKKINEIHDNTLRRIEIFNGAIRMTEETISSSATDDKIKPLLQIELAKINNQLELFVNLEKKFQTIQINLEPFEQLKGSKDQNQEKLPALKTELITLRASLTDMLGSLKSIPQELIDSTSLATSQDLMDLENL